VLDAARQQVAAQDRRYALAGDQWVHARSGRRVTARQRWRLERLIRSRFAQGWHRNVRIAAWIAKIAADDVVTGVVQRRYPNGACDVRVSFGAYAWVTRLPRAHQIGVHYPGDSVAVRLTTQLGGRCTERDPVIWDHLMHGLLGEPFRPAVWTPGPAGSRQLHAVVDPAAYPRWVAAAPTFRRLSGRPLSVHRVGSSPRALVRQVLRVPCEVLATQAGVCIRVPRRQFGRWCHEYARYLPVLAHLTHQRVWFDLR
jgi:hypothetical protein